MTQFCTSCSRPHHPIYHAPHIETGSDKWLEDAATVAMDLRRYYKARQLTTRMRDRELALMYMLATVERKKLDEYRFE